MSVFQDLGYQLENADMGSGFITAASATRNHTGFLDALAGQTSSGNTRATAFVEALANGMARVRLNFLNTKNSSSRWGQQSRDDRPILDPQTYRSAWEKIDQAIFTRSATTAVAPSPAGVQPSGAAASPALPTPGAAPATH
ncbi:hypothetical protein [Sphingomonas sp.]|uniref:hypothetical protein n=1 Tax=Sphingomonas sp. TaxID=28214 RepID=UPI003CC5F51B